MVITSMEVKRYPTPIIPPDHRPEGWEQVYLHYTKPTSLFPILEYGVISKKLADRAQVPYTHTNIPKVQEAEGFEWISVWDPDSNKIALEYPLSSDLVVVTRKLITKSRPLQTDVGFSTERVVKNRIAPRDIIALWMSEGFYQTKIGQIVVSRTNTKEISPWMKLLAATDPDWNDWLQQRTEKTLNKIRDTLNPNLSPEEIEQVVHERIYPRFIRDWIKHRFNFDPTEARMSDLVSQLRTNLPIFIRETGPLGTRILPLNDYQQLHKSPEDDFMWELTRNYSYWPRK